MHPFFLINFVEQKNNTYNRLSPGKKIGSTVISLVSATMLSQYPATSSVSLAFAQQLNISHEFRYTSKALSLTLHQSPHHFAWMRESTGTSIHTG
jgi:hypothetical protein